VYLSDFSIDSCHLLYVVTGAQSSILSLDLEACSSVHSFNLVIDDDLVRALDMLFVRQAYK
jgi:hypothetical protein